MNVAPPVQARASERDALLLDGQRKVLELLARGAPFPVTLSALCEVIERRIPQAICSILLLDRERGVLRHGAAPRVPGPYSEAIDGLSIGPSVGSCGTAAYAGRNVIVEDIATDPLWKDFRSVALAHDLRACASIPIFDPEGPVLGTFAIYHSHAGPFEPRELAVLHDFTGLATVVIQKEQRRAELAEAEARLRQAQKLDSLGVLAGGIAHDFNNLLTIMLANLSFAEEQIGPRSGALPYLKDAEAAALRASDLTKQMLAYAGKGRFVVRAVDLGRTIDEMGHLLSVALPKKVRLSVTPGADLPAIEADVAQLQQVVMNLVTNAAESIGNTEGAVHVATSVVHVDHAGGLETTMPQPLPPGRYVMLEVSDTGCGMTPEIISRIFDPFFSTKKTGRGLGLSAILGILRSHRAGLRLRSEPGKGSTFELFFPVAADEVAPPAEETRPRTAAPRGGLALVVDDEPALRDIVSQVMRLLGFEVLTAEDGVEALAVAAQRGQEMSVVLMDLTMPRMGGAEALVELRKVLPDLPVIVCSGYSEDELLRAIPPLSRVEFLQKPYQFGDVERAVGAALRGAERRATTR